MSQILQLGSTLQGGKYIIKKVLGQGGFGITYLAEHDLLGTKVAIKEFFMKDFCNRDETTSQVSIGTESSREQVSKFREKFLKEARNIAMLHHPNIVRISDVFEENGTAYYVMDYCEGGSLSELIKLHPAGLGEALALKYIRQVASALEQIHTQKMNHLDVKPANILLDAQGNAVLIDFGLSKQYDATGSQTSTTPVGISHGYAPMEQYKQGGVSEFSPATDIYSLGATLYKLITGQTPPEAQMLLEEELPAFAATPSVSNAIRKAMQVRRSDRPQTIAEWVKLLDVNIRTTSNVSTGNSSSQTINNSNQSDDEATLVAPKSGWQEEEEARQLDFQEKMKRAQEEAARKAAEEARKQAETEARRKAEEEARKKEELRQYEEDRKRQVEARRREEESRRVEEEGKKKSKNKTFFFAIGIVAVIAIIIAVIPTTSNYEKAIDSFNSNNPEQGLDYLRKAIAQGDAEASNYLGWCYETGLGVDADPEKAFNNYRISSERGSLYGMVSLGGCYLVGLGTKIDYQKALGLFNAAAIQGNEIALLRLGWLYYSGRIVDQDFKKAKEYFSSAVEHGDEQSKDFLLAIDQLTGNENGHEWVDLGLPSKTKWATCNVGANSSLSLGSFFFFDKNENKNNTVDPVPEQWGKKWRSPSNNDFEELVNNCNIYKLGAGYLVVSKINNNSIFLPGFEMDLPDGGKYLQVDYWSNEFYDNEKVYALAIMGPNPNNEILWYADYREKQNTCPIRPVLVNK